MTISKNEIGALLDRFPGPLMIWVSITRYLFGLAGAGVFVAAGIWFVQSAETLAAAFVTPHGPVRGEGFLRMLILLGVARDMPQAIVELGWIAVVFGGLGVLFGATALLCGVTGISGLALDKEGFIVKALKRNVRHDWADVGDFDILEVPKSARRLSRICVVFNDYQAPETPIKWLQISGRNRVLLESYEYPAVILASAMSIWRERALRARASRDR